MLRTSTNVARRVPVGAEVQPSGGVHFRVWAPKAREVEVVFDRLRAGASDARGAAVKLAAEDRGYYSGHVPQASAGALYRFRLNGEGMLYPDPASRFQPQGCHEASEVIDPTSFVWHDTDWPGRPLEGQVLYELHIGTFTQEGTWQAAARELPELARIGITMVEVMPVAEFHGRFGWGYDGVDLYAPTRLYGRPDDFRRFVDTAHHHGLGVMLDVVYNHFGPSGNYTGAFSPHYLSQRHRTDWGDALNFDGEGAAAVREFFIHNAGYWIDEFHIDGLRLDATHSISDDSQDHLLAAVGRRVREAAGERQALVIAEHETQEAHLVRSPDEQGYGFDGVWNDDFHHTARVAMTGHNEYYYGDYQGTPQELISAVKWGYLYQGQWNARQGRQRGTPAWDVPGKRFVIFLQNHDQIANSGLGMRVQSLTSPGRYRAMTALLLLAPGTPLLFQGQEFGASAPFLYFADHEVDLAKLVREGRQESMRQFRSMAGPDSELCFFDPCAIETFERSKLDLSEREKNAGTYLLHQDLLKLRREDPVFRSQRSDRVHGAVLAPEAFALRYLSDEGDDRLVLVNMGRDVFYAPAAEPLLAAPVAGEWQVLWSSENPRYGGSGSGILDTKTWHIPGHAAIVLAPGT